MPVSYTISPFKMKLMSMKLRHMKANINFKPSYKAKDGGVDSADGAEPMIPAPGSRGTTLRCIKRQDDGKGAPVFAETHSHDMIGRKEIGELVVVAGDDENIDGYMMVPILPRGAVERVMFEQEDPLGKYKIEISTVVLEGHDHSHNPDGNNEMKNVGDVVQIVEIQRVEEKKRIRGRLATGGWISIRDTDGKHCWARPALKASSCGVIVNAADGPDVVSTVMSMVLHPVCLLLLCVPGGWITRACGPHYKTWFWVNLLALVPLAKILGDAVEEVAALVKHPGARSLLNAVFGNIVLIIFVAQALRVGLVEMVQASLLGSVLYNVLLVLGTALFMGGLARSTTDGRRAASINGGEQAAAWINQDKVQKFAGVGAQTNFCMLLVACVSIVLPAIFPMGSSGGAAIISVSRVGSGIIASTYIAYLVHQHQTHQGTLEGYSVDDYEKAALGIAEIDDDEEGPGFTLVPAVLVLLVTTALVVVNMRFMVEGIIHLSPTAGVLSENFIGMILVPIFANAYEHASAVRFAKEDRPGLAIAVLASSSTQIALLVVPFAVFLGWATMSPMELGFQFMNATLTILGVLVALLVTMDGRSTWIKGYMLIAAYVFIAVCYWYAPLNPSGGSGGGSKAPTYTAAPSSTTTAGGWFR